MPRKQNRRQHGEGSLFKRKDGRWVAQLELPPKNGRRNLKPFYGATADEAMEKRQRFKDSQREGFTPATGRGEFLGAYLNHWLYNVIRAEVRENTWHTHHRPKVEKHLIAKLGHIRLPKFVEDDVEVWKTEMLKEYAPRTVLACLRLLSQALDLAAQRRIIPRNVCHYVKPPRVTPGELLPPERDEALILLNALPSRRNGVRWAVALAAGPRRGESLGLMWPMVSLDDLDNASIRIAWELVRLPWQHGCEDPHACGVRHHIYPCPAADCPRKRASGRPHVCRRKVCPAACDGAHPGRCIKAWCRRDCTGHAKGCPARRGGGLVLTEPKSEKSRRTFMIPRPLAEWLALHRMAQAAERDRPGWKGWAHVQKSAAHPDGCERRPRPRELVCPRCRRPMRADAMVFTEADGRPVSPSDDWREWSALLAELGIPHYRPHDARHFTATTLLEEGVDIRVVQELLGHSSPDFTRQAYQHVTVRLQSDAAQKMGGALWPAPGDSQS